MNTYIIVISLIVIAAVVFGIFAARYINKLEKKSFGVKLGVYDFISRMASTGSAYLNKKGGLKETVKAAYLHSYSDESSSITYTSQSILDIFFQKLQGFCEEIELIGNYQNLYNNPEDYRRNYQGFKNQSLGVFELGLTLLQGGKKIYVHLAGSYFRTQTVLPKRGEFGELAELPGMEGLLAVGVISNITIFAPLEGHDLKKDKVKLFLEEAGCMLNFPESEPCYYTPRIKGDEYLGLMRIPIRRRVEIDPDLIYEPFKIGEADVPMSAFLPVFIRGLKKGNNAILYGLHGTGKSSLLHYIVQNINNSEYTGTTSAYSKKGLTRVIKISDPEQIQYLPEIIEDELSDSSLDVSWVVLFDEADNLIKGEEKHRFMAMLLEMMTGPLADRVSFVLSTNLMPAAMNKAVLKPHRTQFQLHLTVIDRERAESLAEYLRSSLDEGKVFDNELYRQALSSGTLVAGSIFSCVRDDFSPEPFVKVQEEDVYPKRSDAETAKKILAKEDEKEEKEEEEEKKKLNKENDAVEEEAEEKPIKKPKRSKSAPGNLKAKSKAKKKQRSKFIRV